MFTLKHLIYFLTLSKHFDDKRAENKAYKGRLRCSSLGVTQHIHWVLKLVLLWFLYENFISRANVSACKGNSFDLERLIEATLKLDSIWLSWAVIIMTEVPSTNHSPSNLSLYKALGFLTWRMAHSYPHCSISPNPNSAVLKLNTWS